MCKKLLFTLLFLVVVGCQYANVGKNTDKVTGQFNQQQRIIGNAESEKDTQTLEEKLLQQLLDKSDLNRYFHADALPERKPLVIINNGIVKKVSHLEKFDRPVLFMEKDEIEKSSIPYLEIRSLIVSDKESKINYSYRVEGIRGAAIFAFVNGKWNLTEENISEQ